MITANTELSLSCLAEMLYYYTTYQNFHAGLLQSSFDLWKLSFRIILFSRCNSLPQAALGAHDMFLCNGEEIPLFGIQLVVSKLDQLVDILQL